jgi:uncharacterized OsmC-like protein
MSSTGAGEGIVIVEGDASGYSQQIAAGTHRFTSDEPVAAGGTETGPSPYQLLLAALGSCTSLTVAMYARRKAWPLKRVRVRLAHSKIWAEDSAHCDTQEGRVDRIERQIEFEGDLSPDQRARLLEIAEKCPVHRTLESKVDIVTRML